MPKEAFEKIMAHFKEAGVNENGWLYTTQAGTYGTDYLQRALITASQAEQIEVRHLGALAPAAALAPATPAPPPPAAWMPAGEPTLEHIEREYLASLLKKYGGNRRKVAEVMGVSERTAYRMMDRHGYK